MIKNEAISDIIGALLHWRMWLRLGWQDIKLRYKRSTLGPFWITISMAITIYSIGFLYSHLFKTNIDEYFPYLASGLICWSFISTSLIESTNIFIESESYIKNAEVFYTVFLMRLITRNTIILLHNIVAYLPIIFIYKVIPGINSLLLIPAIFIISLNVVLWGSILGILGTRFRDLSQIVVSMIQVLFFITPIMWLPTLLPDKAQWVINLNPFYHFLTLLRYPFINERINLLTLSVVISVSCIGILFFIFLMKKYKNRIVFWL